jgi:hypothetical protein
MIVDDEIFAPVSGGAEERWLELGGQSRFF